MWQEYLPMRRQIRNLYSPFTAIPDPAIAEINKATRSFDRIEIWSRAHDPMAVGVIGEEKPRYFSIVRWGDAELTLAQVKRRLWVEKWLPRLTATGGILVFLVTMLATKYPMVDTGRVLILTAHVFPQKHSFRQQASAKTSRRSIYIFVPSK